MCNSLERYQWNVCSKCKITQNSALTQFLNVETHLARYLSICTCGTMSIMSRPSFILRSISYFSRPLTYKKKDILICQLYNHRVHQNEFLCTSWTVRVPSNIKCFWKILKIYWPMRVSNNEVRRTAGAGQQTSEDLAVDWTCLTNGEGRQPIQPLQWPRHQRAEERGANQEKHGGIQWRGNNNRCIYHHEQRPALWKELISRSILSPLVGRRTWWRLKDTVPRAANNFVFLKGHVSD